MKILVIGAGGREHAIATSLSKNTKVEEVYFSKHNGGAKGKIKNANLKSDDFNDVYEFIQNKQIDFVVVGPEKPLNEGIVDKLSEKGIKVFGPKQKESRLEGSKAYAKEFMVKYEIPTAKYGSYNSYEQAESHLGDYGYPTVIKADGLCAGKGVYICQDINEAKEALKEIFIDKVFKNEGSSVVIEEYLSGFEASLLCFVSGNKVYPFDTAMDYKKIYEDDKGPNTGGVGCISPNPYWNDELNKQSNEILRKIEKGFENENLSFSGIIFIGYLIQDGKVYVLEFNMRFGDPETEVLLPRLKSDLLENMMEAINHQEVKLNFEDQVAMTTILVSNGYPKVYKSGYKITGLNNLPEDMIVYHNGTKLEDDKLLTSGGRVLSVVAKGKDLQEARNKVYENIDKVKFDNLYYRKDIGKIK